MQGFNYKAKILEQNVEYIFVIQQGGKEKKASLQKSVKETRNFHYREHSHCGMRFLGSDKLWFSMKLKFLLRIYCKTCTNVVASFFPSKPPFVMNDCKYFWTLLLQVTAMH